MSTPLTPSQLSIIQHSLDCDQYGRRQHSGYDRNHFVTDPDSFDGVICEQLVSLGFMKSFGSQGEMTGGMTLYRVTPDGQSAMLRDSLSPPKTKKVSRSEQRYLDFLHEDSSMTFGEWLKNLKNRQPSFGGW